MIVHPAVEADVPSWLEIVREVEPLFGPMPDFETTLLRKIGQQAALCVRTGDAEVLGRILLGGTRDHGWIRWLAVRSKARAGGVGGSLVEAAMRRMKTAKTISLDTFREEETAGWPARRLYSRHGFVAGPIVDADGRPRQRFVYAR
jgi:GNAT superfamily N-acetyltransferase